MSYAASVRAVRACFGLSQRELGAWLGLGRVFLARVESGDDQLPAHAWRWLAPWLTALAAAEAEAPTPEPQPVPAPVGGPAVVLARIAECRYQGQRLQQQLRALRSQRLVLRRRVAAGPGLRAALSPTEPAHDLRRRWLARLLEAATDGLAAAHPATGELALLLLAARHRAWVQEAEWLEAWVAAPRPDEQQLK